MSFGNKLSFGDKFKQGLEMISPDDIPFLFFLSVTFLTFLLFSYFTMTKCNICNEKLAELFLEKIKGTIVYKPGSKKQYYVCFLCQKKFPGKEEMLKFFA